MFFTGSHLGSLRASAAPSIPCRLAGSMSAIPMLKAIFIVFCRWPPKEFSKRVPMRSHTPHVESHFHHVWSALERPCMRHYQPRSAAPTLLALSGLPPKQKEPGLPLPWPSSAAAAPSAVAASLPPRALPAGEDGLMKDAVVVLQGF